MPVFAYRARDSHGRRVQGRVEARDAGQAAARLRSQGLVVLGLEPDRDLGVMLNRHRRGVGRRIAPRTLAVFCRQFATMVSAGLPLITALRTLAAQAPDSPLGRALRQVHEAVESGDSLARAFGRAGGAFPPLMIDLIAAGEVGGMLEDVLDRLALYLEREENLRQKIRSALTYPAVVLGAAVVIVAFLVTFVLPTFATTYADLGAELPRLTRLLLHLSHGLTAYWWVALLLAAATGVGLGALLRTEAAATAVHRWLLRLPVWGPLLRGRVLGRFCRVLGGLLHGGVPILRALAVVENIVGNKLVARAVRSAQAQVQKGRSLAAPLQESGVFPPLLTTMLATGEEAGRLEEMLSKVADFYESEVERLAERLAAALEPILIVLLTVVVGFIVLAMMLPIFDVWSSFEH